ncbi:MAG: hypothetical protein ACOZQL_22105 [Myxococcota bacterium]
MQLELDAEFPGAFQFIGVNGIGYEASNAQMTDGRVLPWLQDVPSVEAWALWRVEYRDVVILDSSGRERARFNLTTHDLAQQANRDALKQKLLEAR